MTNEEKLINALLVGVKDARADVKIAAYTGMGRMLKNANRQ
ncbi:hypothetical protein RI537_18825 [Aeromonas salmonicida]